MTVEQLISIDVLERLRIIQGLCREIANRLEDEASAQTIPRNYEYDGRRTALLEIADEISKTANALENDANVDNIQQSVQTLYQRIETRKQANLDEQARNVEHQHNFRLSYLYFTPRGAVAGCDKALEWLRESLKSIDLISQKQPEDSVTHE